MEEEEYWRRVDIVTGAVSEATIEFPEFQNQVIRHWRYDIAPIKHRDYGIECWERLGPKALVADLSALYYRYKQLFGRHIGDPSLANAIVDAFGYAVIYNVCLGVDNIQKSILRMNMLVKEPVGYTNEIIIKHAWDRRDFTQIRYHTLRQSFNMYRGQKP